MGTTCIIVFKFAGGGVENRCLIIIPVIIVSTDVVVQTAFQDASLHASLVAVDDFRVESLEILRIVVEIKHSRTTATSHAGVDVVAANHIVEGCTTYP